MKYFKIFIPLLFLLSFMSCAKKESFDNTKEKVGISRVINFPIMNLKGDRYMVVTVGGTFTDPGVAATVGGADIPSTVEGTVNTSTSGVYNLVYSAVNSDGFSASVTRTVAVYSTDASAEANDLSGTYLRELTGLTSTWTKLAPGVYKVVNPGGAGAGTALTVIVFNNTGLTIKIPPQVSNDGNISTSSNETYTNATATSPATFTWKFLNPGYGAGFRIFIKQ